MTPKQIQENWEYTDRKLDFWSKVFILFHDEFDGKEDQKRPDIKNMLKESRLQCRDIHYERIALNIERRKLGLIS